MKTLFAAVALMLLVAGGANAQNLWSPEIGIQGGFARLKPAGTGASDQQDEFTIPGIGSPPALYVVIPAGDRLAIEPSLALAQLTFGLALDAVNLGLRANYALSPKFYAAGGAGVNYTDAFGVSDYQLGLQVAVGYRLRLSGRLNGRVEASWTTWAKTDNFDPFNTYALQFGMSAGLRGRAAAPARRAPAPGACRPVIGVSGGYAKIHQVGGGDIATLAIPGITSALTAGGGAAAPTLFASFPIGRRWALEPGLDLNWAQGGGSTATVGQLTARMAYTVQGGWYAAAGPHILYARQSGSDAATVLGANVAWGYRFPLVADLGGRFELNYFSTPQNDDFQLLTGAGATNTFGATFAVTMPLK